MTALETFDIASREGISSARLHMLLLLVDDSPLSMTELAKRAHTSKANATGLVQRLERDGWVVYERNRDDLRQQLAIPTMRTYELFSTAVVEQE